jgi:hypothetical protein
LGAPAEARLDSNRRQKVVVTMLDNAIKCTKCDKPINENADTDWTIELVGHLKPGQEYPQELRPEPQYFCHPMCLHSYFSAYVIDVLREKLFGRRPPNKEPGGEPHGPH